VLEFVEWNDSAIKSLQARLAALARFADLDQRALSSMVETLLRDMRNALMLPFTSLLEGFPKLVRDLSRDRGKEAELVIQGGGVEADRRILEEMKDPLVHLVRNSIDHGIEDPEAREREKKPRRGKITLAISQKDGDKVEILVSDDGAGVNISKVQAAALKLGICSEEDAREMSEQDALSLIFHSGVSTSPMITELSGRGLGLAIVREKAEKVGGTVSIETQTGAGTTVRAVLPLTLATFRGVLVREGENLLTLPATYVERAVRVSQEGIKTVENRETIQVNDEVVSLVPLGEALGLPRKSAPREPARNVHAVVLGAAGKRVAFRVDEIVREQEVLVKNLGKELSRLRHVAGAVVLGTGKVVPVLNVPELIKTAGKSSFVAWDSARTRERPQERKSIVIAEDSITARTLLKNILEAAGFRVKTAVDGVDAFTALRTEEFNLLVSDVDMPRMSGFDLTAKIRADRKLSGLPVVLVTALESREDRERGIDVGASAYIVKSSFDQSNLLEVIRRLIGPPEDRVRNRLEAR
jgi:two-component system chemotaxis sensor kinase CheA